MGTWYTRANGNTSGPHSDEQAIDLISRHGDYIEIAPPRASTWQKPSETEFAKHVPDSPVEPSRTVGAHALSPSDTHRPGLLIAGLVAVAALVGIVALAVDSSLHSSSTNDAPPQPAAVPKVEEPPPNDPAVIAADSEARNARVAALKKGGPAMRLQVAKSLARSCIASATCDSNEAANLVASSIDQKDGEVIASVIGATMSAMACKRATDGGELSVDVIKLAYEPLLKNGKSGLKHLPTCTRGAAAKDPAVERGRVITVAGQVVQIRRDGPLFVGNIVAEGLKTAYFVTPFSTANIEEGTYATFRGIFVQNYAFENVSGGETQAVALLGAFD